MVERRLDLITIGRVSVDLYGGQVGGRLEDMARFNKYVGGCPANIAVGAARLGLRTALLSRVGDEAMGRFIREQLGREGVDTSHLITDRQRLTALVILGIRDRETFPLIFFRENCADMALECRRFRTRVHRFGAGGGGHRHAFLHAHGGRIQHGCGGCRQGGGQRGHSRHRLPTGAVGARRSWHR